MSHPRYSEEQVKRWLAWLARGMTRDGETVFLMSRIQRGWLDTLWMGMLYVISSRLAGALPFGVLTAIGLTLLVGQTGQAESHEILFFFSVGCVLGLMVGVGLDAIRNYKKLVIGLVAFVAVASGVLIAIHNLGPSDGGGFTDSLDTILLIAIWFGVPGIGLIVVEYRTWKNGRDIHTVESLKWTVSGSARRALQGALLFAAVPVLALLVSNVLRVMWSDKSWDFDFGFHELLVCMAMGGPLGAFFGATTAPIERHSSPNQGITTSLRVAITVGAMAFVLGLAITFTLHFLDALKLKLGAEEVAGVSTICALFGLAAAWWFGGQAVLRHYVLRVILSVFRITPFRLPGFLDYAAELGFLQKVGGGYMFIHRYLLEHFAAMEPKKTTAASGPAGASAMPPAGTPAAR